MNEPIVHVGYHKSGTTWLQRTLFARADLGYRRLRFTQDGVDVVRLHDFDFDAARCRDEMARKVESCVSQGLVPVVSSERLSGNPHSGGYDSRTLADRIAAALPRARVLIGIREQRSMILSSYAQYVKAGGPCSLRSYLHAAYDKRRPGFRFEHFCYDRLIAHYQRRLGRDRVLVQCYERFRAEPRTAGEEIAAFCGGKAPPPEAGDVVLNRGLGAVTLTLLPWLNPFLKADSLNGWSPYAVRWLSKPVRHLLESFDRVSPRLLKVAVDRRWRRILEAATHGRYEESNRRTAALTGCDLARWGYRL